MTPTTYAAAGVDIAAQDRAIALFRDAVRATFTPAVVGDLGSFGGLYSLEEPPVDRPVLTASIDSVGTKVMIAAAAGRYRGLGHDIVNHCVNDIAVLGAEPLFFLDYVGVPDLEPERVAEIVGGVAEACGAVGCALLGGELAELPGMYRPGTMDLVGAVVGVVDRRAAVTGERIVPGDAVIGLPSSGLHTNGYSLARRVLLEEAGLALEEEIGPSGANLADALLAVHRCYWPALRALRGGLLKGAAHITGGGLLDNPPCILPPGCGMVLRRGSWPEPPIFGLLAERSGLTGPELYRTLNLGLGLLVVTARADAEAALAACARAGQPGCLVGEVTAGGGVEVREAREG